MIILDQSARWFAWWKPPEPAGSGIADANGRMSPVRGVEMAGLSPGVGYNVYFGNPESHIPPWERAEVTSC